ncbi:MAG: glycosyltransferase [Actinomycetota bacterium]|nr:glycosyltransferase [Actinomycetota bacterium]
MSLDGIGRDHAEPGSRVSGDRAGRGASVLIRTKNEAAHLGSTLEGVLEQSIAPYEVLVIDSGSTDATLDVAARYPVRVLTISPEVWSYPRALNLAAAEAVGDVLVSLSAHCIPATRHWLGNLLRHFDDPEVAAVWGPGLRPGRPVPELGQAQRQLPGTYNVLNRTWGLSNANSALRRELWMQFPFDEALPATEDKAWGREAMRRGYSIVFEPDAAVWHETHSVLRAYRRNRAVMEGFRMMFPELESPTSGQLRLITRAAWNTLLFHVRNPASGSLLRDLARAPSTVAAVLGAYLAGQSRPR